jgi:hypothetical protein
MKGNAFALTFRCASLALSTLIVTQILGSVYRPNAGNFCYYGMTYPVAADTSAFGKTACVGGVGLATFTMLSEFILLILLIRPGINSYVTYGSR